MKRILLSLFISVFVSSLYAIDRKAALIDSLENTLFSVMENKKVNFRTIQGKTLAVYNGAIDWGGTDMRENMSAVKENGKWGFINNKGVMVIPAIYESKFYGLHFAEGVAVVHKDGKWGAIDKTGKTVVPFVWNKVVDRLEGLARFYEGLLLVKDKKWGYIDKTGKIVVSCVYDDGGRFSEGMAGVKKDDKWGFVDKTGALKIPCVYDGACMFSEGMAGVKKDDKWGFVDKNGELKIPCIYDELSGFSEGMAGVKKNGKWGFLDKNGELKIPCVYEDAQFFSEGLVAVKQNGRWGYIDKEGKVVISFNYKGSYIGSFSHGFAMLENNGKKGVVNKHGEVVVPFNYDSWYGWRSSDGLIYAVYKNKHYDVGVVKDGEINLIALETAGGWNAEFQGYQWLYNELKKEMAENTPIEAAPKDVVKKDDVRETAPELAVSAEKKQPTPPTTKPKAEVDTVIPVVSGDNENTFALIFANEDYSENGVQDVDFAANDGEIFKEYCIKTLGMPQDNVHIRKNATLNQIRSEINWVKNVADAYDGEAKFIIYYAGHGVPDEKTKDAYLLPSDGLANDPQSGYSLAALYKELGMLPAQQVLVFLDACFSGAQRGGDMLMAARATVMKPRPLTPKGNMVVFTASYGDETAYPYKDKGHGLFTYFLLKKLNETKGDATLGDIYEYVREKVDRYSIVKNNKRQTPTITMSEGMRPKWQQLKLK